MVVPSSSSCIVLSVAPPLVERSYWSIPNGGSDSAYRAILRIAKTGCHLVAIAQVVEH